MRERIKMQEKVIHEIQKTIVALIENVKTGDYQN